MDPDRSAFLEANGGYFAPEFVPTTLVNYLRPDGVRFTSVFPWVDFPPAPGPIVGSTDFDFLDRTSSIPSAMAVFVILALIAVVVVVRRPATRRALGPMVLPLVGAVAAALAILPFGYVSNRYLADVAPLMILLAAVGVQGYLLVAETSDRWIVRPLWGALGALVLFGVWVNIGLGLLFQRVYSTVDAEETTAALVGWQIDADRIVGQGSLQPSRLDSVDALPAGSAGDLVVFGDCEAMYLNDGNPTDALRGGSWIPVERTIDAGRRPLRVVIAANAPGTRVPLGSSDGVDGPTLLVMETTADGQRLIELRSPTFTSRGAPFDVALDEPVEMLLVADPRLRQLSVTVDDEIVFETYLDVADPLVLGRDVTVGEVAGGPMPGPVAHSFDGTIEELPGSTASLCRELVGRADGTD